tara:strand:- start:3203 stop:3955 length:753 start_codon:yes stop_codon:yes gene_type:complete
MKYLLVVLLLLSLSSIGQTKIVESNSLSWWANVNNYTFSDKLYATSEIHIRRSDFVENWQQFLVRPTITYVLNTNVNIGVGYSHLENYPYGKQPISIQTPENNVFEQLVLSQKAGKVSFKHRYRLEHRFIGKTTTYSIDELIIEGTNYAQRFRYQFSINFDIKKFENDRKIFFTGYDEIFLNLNNSFTISNFNQNWTLLAIGYQFNKKLSISAGYRNQWTKSGDNVHYENNHALDFTLKYNFDFRKNIEE